MAGLALRARLTEAATTDPGSPIHGFDASAIDAAGGYLVARADPSKRDSFADVVSRSGKPEISAEAHTEAKEDRKRFSTHSFGADFVEVRVDEDLGEVRVARVVATFAAGRILNAKTARSQFYGGLVWGIGMALEEHTVRDARTARVVTRDLADYHVPVNADVPDLEVISVAEDDPHVNEIGAKGIGEIGITGIAAAIANAVYHATGSVSATFPSPSTS
jgi:xanthine dehydrogenase YagR molybdenum-binding subunit